MKAKVKNTCTKKNKKQKSKLVMIDRIITIANIVVKLLEIIARLN